MRSNAAILKETADGDTADPNGQNSYRCVPDSRRASPVSTEEGDRFDVLLSIAGPEWVFRRLKSRVAIDVFAEGFADDQVGLLGP